MSGEDEYRALDVSGLCNARAELISAMRAPLGAPAGPPPAAPTGRQTFHGLPFLVGRPGATAGQADVIILRGDRVASVSVPVASNARWLIFVHRLLESRVYEGASIGGAVARYIVRFDDGTFERIPIRERFEIAIPDERWTQVPFLAWWDRDYDLPSRRGGPWEEAGVRQTESAFPGDVSWTLYPWRNPRPATAIASVEIEPAGPAFAFGGITLGMLDEHPIRAAGARDVVVTLDDPPDVGLVFGSSGGRVTDA